MTEADIQKIMKQFLASVFPMACSFCGHRYTSYKDFLQNTTHLGGPISYDAERGDWQPEKPLGSLSFANCACGNTITIATDIMPKETMQALLNWAKGETAMREVSAEELLRQVRQNLVKQILGD